MAVYKYQRYLTSSTHEAFDATHAPASITSFSGIYQCEVCGEPIVSTVGHPLPPQNHHQHNPARPIAWRLTVATK